MGKSAYPTATELNSFLTEAGFVLGSLDTATAVEAAVDEFHRRTGRIMLAPVGAAVRYYDPPAGTTRFLDLEADLAVLTSIVYAPTGQTLTQNKEYWLRPYAAGSEETGPFLAVEFARCWVQPLGLALRRAIQVTGRWGYATAIPEDAWTAMLHRAAALLAPSRGGKLSSGHVSTEDAGPVNREYGADPLGGLRRAWDRNFDLAVRRYRRTCM